MQSIRKAGYRFRETDVQPLCLKLYSAKEKDGRQYNRLTCSEVTALLVDDFGTGNTQSYSWA